MFQYLYFIDTKLSNYQSILDSLSSNDGYYLINSDQDGLTQIATILLGYSNLDAIHIFSHGSSGSLNLGNSTYNQTNISLYESLLQQIGGSLATNGDILLYGCNVAQGDIGKAFIDTLAAYTGADVAASTDLTGVNTLGGDWILETSSGSIEADTVAVSKYETVLMVVNTSPSLTTTTTLFAEIEDVAATHTVADVLAALGWSDVDSFTMGAALVGLNANAAGAWTISFDGIDFISFTQEQELATSPEMALLVTPNTILKFIPNPDSNDSTAPFVNATFQIKAWDMSSGIMGTIVDTTVIASGSPYSLETATVIGSFAAVNDAPILLPASDPHVSENGVLIASIQGIIGDPDVPDFHKVIDPDANGVYGIAITGEATAPVTVYYSTTGANIGAVWYQITAENLAAGALHLLANGNTYIKVVPDQDYSGTISNFLSVIAWDGTNGITNGTYAPIIATGGSTAYSIYEEHPDLIVDPVSISTNTAPTLTMTSNTITLDEDSSHMTVTMEEFLAGVSEGYLFPEDSIMQDADNGAQGIAITHLDLSAGTYFFSTDGGNNWIQINAESVSESNAIHLAANGDSLTMFRFILTPNFNGTVENWLTQHAWDQTNGVSNGTYAAIGATGGTTAYSVETETGRLIVNPINTAPTFGIGDGKITTVFGSSSGASSVILQPDGKILLGGANDGDFALARYNNDGSLDTTFDNDGKVTTDISPINDYGASVAIQADGKILLAGAKYNDYSDFDFALLRYNSDGSLDTTFDGDGIVTTDYAGYGNEGGYSVTVQTDGGILIGGYANGNFALGRYNSDGSLDTTFGADGKVITDFNSTFDVGLSVIHQPDGKILMAGYSSTCGYSCGKFALARYNSDGSLDTTFDSDGKVITSVGGSNDSAWSVILQEDGKILLAGCSYNGVNFDFALVRYNSDGSLDTTFDSDGKVTTPIGLGNDTGRSVTLQADGKIIVAGDTANGSNYDFALVRYNSDGSLDTTFGGDGKVTTDFGPDDFIQGVTVQADGKIVVAGGNGNFVLARYNSDGSLDTSFDTGILNGNSTFIENGTPSILDSDVQIYDAELSALGNYGGAVLTLARDGGANSGDKFSGAGIVAGTANGNIIVSATTVGTYSYSSGTLVLTFNTSATQTLVNQTIQSIAYSNTVDNPPSSVQIDWTFSDGNIGGALSVTGGTTVNIVQIDFIGDKLANILIGNEWDNTLNGGAGADTMVGGLGDDTYYVDNKGDIITEAPLEGDDTVYSKISYTLTANVENLILEGTVSNKAYGNDLDNTLTGNKGSNLLDGGLGADTMIGGLGKDIYYVDNINDTVTETSTLSTEIDIVNSSVSCILSDNVENLTLIGTAAVNATGNSLNNVLLGNSADNILNGGTGIDKMTGGLGNDIYYVDNIKDVVTEKSTLLTEIDTVMSSINSYILGKNVENLTLTDSAIKGIGNKAANIVIGNDGNNLLYGKEGQDTLTGGIGNDTFVFDTKLALTNIDTITDFTGGEDIIQLENAIFKKLTVTGALLANNFTANDTGTADSLTSYIVYNTSNGNLYYDADGNKAGGIAAVQIALIGTTDHPELMFSDFLVG